MIPPYTFGRLHKIGYDRLLKLHKEQPEAFEGAVLRLPRRMRISFTLYVRHKNQQYQQMLRLVGALGVLLKAKHGNYDK